MCRGGGQGHIGAPSRKIISCNGFQPGPESAHDRRADCFRIFRLVTTGSTVRGITAYGGITAYDDSASLEYQVAGRGKSGDLTRVLTRGQ